MGWFSKKKDNSHREAMAESLRQQRMVEREMFKAFPIGSSFEYLGVICLVTHHRSYARGHHSPGLPSWPGHDAQISCDYVDNIGVIHRVCFDLDELKRNG